MKPSRSRTTPPSKRDRRKARHARKKGKAMPSMTFSAAIHMLPNNDNNTLERAAEALRSEPDWTWT